MNESESRLSKAKQKEKIRERYKGIDQGSITVIPARPPEDIFKSERTLRVAVYARVSTDDPNQTSSYELQKSHYEEYVSRHPGWELADIYADEGISGTSLNHRDAFVRMIADCRQGKIDLIITKSVSRFARNIEDCIHYSRELKELNPPVGILFETENINTLEKNSEMQLSFIATLAQEESHTKSEVMNGSLEMRFKRGIFLTPVLLGYDHDENGNLIVNEEEAKTVRLIFLLYLSGRNCASIAEILTRLGRKTKPGNTTWAAGSIYGILRNERYAGDILAHKTYTPNYLNHKVKKNDQKRPQYYVDNHHEAIVSRNDFVAVQKLMDHSKYGFKSVVPELKVIDSGALKGFVQINPCWMGFTEVDYLSACHSVLSDDDYLHPTVVIKRRKGEFDFSDYQVTRSQFVSNPRKMSVSIGYMDMKFSTWSIRELTDSMYVELLFHPIYQILVVRKSDKNNLHAVKWASLKDEKLIPKPCKGAGFLPIIYDICGWMRSYRYTLTGSIKERDGEKLLMFYADEPEVRIARDQLAYLMKMEAEKGATAFPSEWSDNFGDSVNMHDAKAQAGFRPDIDWDAKNPGVVYIQSEYKVRPGEELLGEIRELVKEMRACKEGNKEICDWDELIASVTDEEVQNES